jgi:Protein of unknown function (DUF2971)
MILYKYASFDDGSKILEGGSVGFTQPNFFNDPFDLPSYPDEESANTVQGLFARLHTMGKNSVWAENTGILSLTRTPTNPLMWAHYAEKHQGMVIGIDAVAAGLTDEKANLIPAQYGSVIYVSRRQDQPFIGKPQTGLAVGSTYHFPHDHYEKLQRLFLHKPLCWSYEEEVRVVKCLKGVSKGGPDTPSGHFEMVTGNGRELYLYSLPPKSIVELYIGFRMDVFAADALFHQAKQRHPELAVHECQLDSGSLSVEFTEYVTLADAASG